MRVDPRYLPAIPEKVSSVAHDTFSKVMPYVNIGYQKAKSSTGIKVAVGIGAAGLIGFAGYELYNAFTNPQGPGCSQLQTELASNLKEQFTIYNNSVTYHGGTMPASYTQQIATLQKEEASIENQIGKYCSLPAGQEFQKTMDKIIVTAGWLAMGLVIATGLLLSARAVSWFLKRWGGSTSDPNKSPSTPAEADPPQSFSPVNMPADAQSGLTLNNVDKNIITPTEGENVLQSVDSSDPMAANSVDLTDFFTQLADSAELEELFTFFDSLAEDMAAIAATDGEIVDEAAADLVALGE